MSLFKHILFVFACFVSVVSYGQNDQLSLSFYTITSGSRWFQPVFIPGDNFGSSVAVLNDFDGDGNKEIAVGAAGADIDGAVDVGAVYVLFIDDSGGVKKFELITGLDLFDELQTGVKNAGEVACVGDYDGDGIFDIVIGAYGTDYKTLDGEIESEAGALFIVCLNADGTVKSKEIIQKASGVSTVEYNNDFPAGSTYNIGAYSHLGASVATADLDGDGVVEIIAGASRFGNYNEGGLIIYKKDEVYLHSKMYNVMENPQAIEVFSGSFFGSEVVPIGDLNGDGFIDIAVHSRSDTYDLLQGGIFNPPASDDGAIHILFLNQYGDVLQRTKLSASENILNGELLPGEIFGDGIASIGDLDGDHVPDIITSASRKDVNGINCGKLYILFMNSDGSIKEYRSFDANSYDFLSSDAALLGADIHPLGDINGDGRLDFSVFVNISNSGAIYVASFDGVFVSGNFSVSGTVRFNENENFPVLVTLFSENESVAVDSAIVDNVNGFSFTSLKGGYYIIRAEPLDLNDSVIPVKIPVYVNSDIVNFQFNMLHLQPKPVMTSIVADHVNIVATNLVANVLSVTSKTMIKDVCVFSETGSLCYMLKNVQSYSSEIDFANLSPAVYVLQIICTDGSRTNSFFVKN